MNEKPVKRRQNAVLALLAIWGASYIYMLLATAEENFFVPSFAVILSWLSLLASPNKAAVPFLAELRIGRAFYSVLLIGVPAFLIGDSAPDWPVVPPMFGLFLLTSALVNRMDARRLQTS
ncbi:hypothetical protein LK540_04270 [Massilia sp. IC2-278]|uniref:hypothetical protein n=1 Tax=Massilia sp. IC2-278 TaxID=2887200 RepID=UPI001E5DD9FC|nr:hypothetical protein [Massilia sp. IC2-278]MCC2959643.1 hypothetical protein [Massilia sp. IC2-278]